MKNIIIVLLLISMSAFAADSSICESLSGTNGLYQVSKLSEKGIISGPYVTDDINEFNDFPQLIKAAAKKYSRSNKISISNFIESQGEVREICKTKSCENKLGFVVTQLNSPSHASEPAKNNGSIYRYYAGRLEEVGTIKLDKVDCSSASANAKTTLYQCAVENVDPDGVRVNVIHSKGKLRANLIFGTTVSGTMYQLNEIKNGYTGNIKNHPEYTIDLNISNKAGQNTNIKGKKAHLNAMYPTELNAKGFDTIETDLICGEKISGSWN